MKDDGILKVFAQGDLEIVMVREFNAPRGLVFDAYTKPEFLKRWLYGPEGWELAVCEMDLRVGGKYRWVWRQLADGHEMGAGGVIREIAAPERIVMTERFDEAWYEGEMVNTITFTEKSGRTTMTATMRHVSKASRDGVLKSPMESGVKMSYDRLAGLLAGLQAAPGAASMSERRGDRPALLRSIGAVLGGFFAVAVVSLAVDSALHATGVYPGWGERMTDAQFVLATVYRILFGIGGGYVTARLAPSRPLAHAVALGVLGTVLSIVGGVVGAASGMGPVWYSIALVVTALPTAWAGGKLWERRAANA